MITIDNKHIVPIRKLVYINIEHRLWNQVWASVINSSLTYVKVWSLILNQSYSQVYLHIYNDKNNI